jgi:ubiquinone biosynthesis protein
VPQFYPELCTKRILTIEFLEGVPVSNLLKAKASEKVKRTAPKIDCDQLAKNLVESSLSQIFRYNFFHADLHPGNLFALPCNRIGFVDFGFCDELDEVVRRQQIQYFSAIYNSNIEQMFVALAEILIPTEATDFEAFRSDFLLKTRIWMNAKQERAVNQSGKVSNVTRSPTTQWLIDLMQTARKHGLRVPPKVLSMYRTLLTLEIVAFQLAPKADLGTVWYRFFQKLQLEEALCELINPQTIQPILLNLATLLQDGPGQLNQILSKMSDGSFAVNVYTSDTPKVISNRNRQTRLLTTSILSVGISLLLTIPDHPSLFGLSLAPVLWSTLFLLYISIFIQWRKLS